MAVRINHAAVWVLVVVHFLLGWGWYAVWGEKWLNLHARTMTDIDRTHNVSAYLLAIATAIVRFGLIPGSSSVPGVGDPVSSVRTFP